MKVYNWRHWNILNFAMSIFILVALNKFIGFNEIRSSYELIMNFSRQIILFSGLNLFSGNLIYFVENNSKSILVFRRLYYFNSIIVGAIILLIFLLGVFFKWFGKDIAIAIILASILNFVDFFGFFALALGKVYVQYMAQFIVKLAFLFSIILMGLFDIDIWIILVLALCVVVSIFFISDKVDMSPALFKSNSIRPVVKEILLFSLPWFLTSPILNFFATYIWLALDTGNSSDLTYYSLVLFGSSALTVLFINPVIDKLTFSAKLGLSSAKMELYLFLVGFFLVVSSYFLKLDYILSNYLFRIIFINVFSFDQAFISGFMYFIPLYVSASIPVLLLTRMAHINRRQKSYAILLLIVAIVQLFVVFFVKNLTVVDFLNFSLCTSFMTFVLMVIRYYKIVNVRQCALFFAMYFLLSLSFLF